MKSEISTTRYHTQQAVYFVLGLLVLSGLLRQIQLTWFSGKAAYAWPLLVCIMVSCSAFCSLGICQKPTAWWKVLQKGPGIPVAALALWQLWDASFDLPIAISFCALGSALLLTASYLALRSLSEKQRVRYQTLFLMIFGTLTALALAWQCYVYLVDGSSGVSLGYWVFLVTVYISGIVAFYREKALMWIHVVLMLLALSNTAIVLVGSYVG